MGGFGIGEETIKYVRKLDFTIASVGESVYVKKYLCKKSGNTCPAAGVRLMFIPEARAYKQDWIKAMTKDKEGYVAAAVLNVDDKDFEDLGLKPGKLAYAWVGQIGTTTSERGFAVYTIDPAGYKLATWSFTTDVEHCDNTAARDKPAVKGEHPTDDVCTKILVTDATRGVRAAYAAAPTTLRALVGGVGKLWISCDGGCCEVKAD
jgi:hypothetical protein